MSAAATAATAAALGRGREQPNHASLPTWLPRQRVALPRRPRARRLLTTAEEARFTSLSCCSLQTQPEHVWTGVPTHWRHLCGDEDYVQRRLLSLPAASTGRDRSWPTPVKRGQLSRPTDLPFGMCSNTLQRLTPGLLLVPRKSRSKVSEGHQLACRRSYACTRLQGHAWAWHWPWGGVQHRALRLGGTPAHLCTFVPRKNSRKRGGGEAFNIFATLFQSSSLSFLQQ